MTDSASVLPARLGPYVIDGVVGAGGMGVVYRAHHAQSGKLAAVKTVFSQRPTDAAALRTEALALAQVSSPGIVALWETGEVDGKPWYAMPLLEGAALATLMPAARRAGATHSFGGDATSTGTLENPDPVALDLLPLFVQLCDSLAVLHAANLLHRDLKPNNIMVSEGRPILLDFGLSGGWIGGVQRESIESRIEMAGTALYVAPEVLDGELPDPRTDLYALGVMLFEACTGTLPFEGDLRALIHQHLNVPAPDPRGRNPDLPADLAVLILELLAKDPVDRPAGADLVGRRLSRVVGLPVEPHPRPHLWFRSRLLGREADLVAIEAAMETNIVAVSGEAGSGKTRLLTALGARAGKRAGAGPAHVWAGECADSRAAIGGVLAPLRPVLGTLVRSNTGDDTWLEHLGIHVPVLAPFDEELARVAASVNLPPSPALQGPAARERVLEAARSVIVRLAETNGALWLIDDLHLCDELTLALLAHRSRFPEAWPRVRIACAFRSEDRNEALHTLFATGGIHEHALENLPPAAMRSLIGSTLGTRNLPPGLIAEVTERAGGNPCFAGELLQCEVADSRLSYNEQVGWLHVPAPSELPRGMRDAAAARIARLSEGRALVKRAAIIGRAVDVRVLATDPAGLHELLSRRVLVLSADGIAKFGHEALRNAALATIPERDLPMAHRDAAMSIEREVPEESSWKDRALAAHWEGAGEPKKAYAALLSAGQRARDAFAHVDAVRLLSRAIELGVEAGVYEGKPMIQAQHLLELATIRSAEGDFANAQPEVDRALILAGHPVGPRHWFTLISAIYRQFALRTGIRPPAPTALPTSTFVATAHTTRSWIGMQGFNPAYLIDAVIRAAHANDDRGPEASPEPYANVAVLCSMSGLPKVASVYFREADRRMAGHPVQAQLRALAMRGLSDLLTGRFPSSQRVNERGATLARGAGERVTEGFFLHQAAQTALFRGRTDDAMAYAARQARPQRAGLGARYLGATEATTLLMRGESEHALELLLRDVAGFQESGGGAALASQLALVAAAHAALGQPIEAQAALDSCEKVCAGLPANGPARHGLHLRRPWILLRLQPRSPEVALRAANEALAYFRRLGMGLACAHAAVAAAEAGMGRWPRALKAAARAFALADADDAGLGARLAAGSLLAHPDLPDDLRARAESRVEAILSAGPLPHWLPIGV